MGVTIRRATEADLDRIVSLTEAYRLRLAEWSPTWWRPSAAAGDLHPFWLAHLLGGDGPILRVAVDASDVVACAVSMPQQEQWFIDDVAVEGDGPWLEGGIALLRAIPERPALTCVPTSDPRRAEASLAAGLAHLSSYWVASIDPGCEPALDASPALDDDLDRVLAPPHSFGGRLDPEAEGALVFGDGLGGVVVGSPPSSAPPVYDPGGTVCLVDRIDGTDRAALLTTAMAAAARRGDVLMNVVASVDDLTLQHVLNEAGFRRTVDVYCWPHRA